MKKSKSDRRPAAPQPEPARETPERETPARENPAPRTLSALRGHRATVVIVTYAIVLYCALQHFGEVRGFLGGVWAVFQPITVGLCIAFVLNVLLNFFEKTLLRGLKRPRTQGLCRALGVLLTLIAALGIVALVTLVVSPKLGECVNLVIRALPQSAGELAEWLRSSLARLSLAPEQIESAVAKLDTLADELLRWIEAEYAMLAGTVLNVTSTLLSFVFDLLLSLIIAIYVLLQKEQIGRAASRVMEAYFPKKLRERVWNVSRLSYSAFSNFVRGQLIEAVILGALCYLGLLILRIPNAPVVGLLVGVTALIPIFGAWIGGGLSAFLILLVDPGKVILFVVFLLILQQVEGNLIYPRVVGSAIGLPGLLVLCAVLVGGNIGGVVGMLMGVPVVAVVYELLRRGVAHRIGKENT